MEQQHFELTTSDGQRLFVRQWLPPAPVATAQILHGIAEHGGRYDHLARRLAAAGFAVYAHDQRGHGRTAGDRSRAGFVAASGGAERLIADAHLVRQHIRARHAGLPHALIGHSMGSLLAQRYAIEHGNELNALALSATDFRPDPMPRLGRRLANTLARLYGPEHRSALLDFLALGRVRRKLPNQRTRYDWLSRDQSIVDAYIADPLCGFVPTVALWRDVFDVVIFNGRRHNQARVPKTLPILLMVGEMDMLSGGGRHVRQLAQRYRALGIADVTLRTYPEARHEIFNELNRDEICGELLRWLRDRLGLEPVTASVGAATSM